MNDKDTFKVDINIKELLKVKDEVTSIDYLELVRKYNDIQFGQFEEKEILLFK